MTVVGATFMAAEVGALPAVGAYLRTLRDAQKKTRAEVAAALDTSESLIVRIEQGEGETRGSLLFAFVKFVGGNTNHLAELFNKPNVSASDGRALAESWLASAMDSVPQDQVGTMIEILRDMQRRLGVLEQRAEYITGDSDDDRDDPAPR